MWLLPMSLRAKMATVILLGIFFIPFATSDLRGLTHVLTCTDAVSASLLVDDTTDGDTAPVLGSADSVTRDEAGLGLCGGLEVDLQLSSARDGRAEVLVAITTTTGTPPEPTGARHPSITPFETFHAADGLFVIAAGNDVLFEKLCVCLDLPLADDARFATNAERCRNARLLKRLIEAVTLDNTCAYWINRLTAAGIPTGPIQNVAQVLKDPQILSRNMVVDVLDRNGRYAFKAAGNPMKVSGTEDKTTRPPAPDLDGNRGEILRWLEQEV